MTIPIKAQRFIKMMEIDKRLLRLMTLTPSPDGKFIKNFNDGDSGLGKRLAFAEFTTIYFFSDYVKVGVAIHELGRVPTIHKRTKGI